MTDKVIKDLKQLKHCITKPCDITCSYYNAEDMICPCSYDVSSDVTIDNAIQTIRELQSNQCHLNSPCEYQEQDIEVK